MDRERRRHSQSFKSAVDRTKQSEAKSADINHIVAQMGGLAFQAPVGGPEVDYSDFPDYLEAMNSVAMVNQSFARLPSKVRERWGNDPANIFHAIRATEQGQVDFVDDLVELGLMEPPKAPEEPVAPAPVVPPVPPSGPPPEDG